jgi:hypothetical protein
LFTFVIMEAKKKDGFVRIRQSVINKVARNKKKSRIPIGQFFELAALEKLEKQKTPVTQSQS